VHRAISVYGRKILGIFLIFNALVTISYAVGILSGYYAAYPHWEPFAPYVHSGALFWLLIVAAILNIFPSANFGKVHTGRLWFHHYVYGFFVMFLSAVWIMLGTSVSLLNMFLINSTNLSVNVGRFFMLGGLSLVLDDLPDVNRLTFRWVRWLKAKACQARKFLHIAQLAMGFVGLYFAAAITIFVIDNPQWLTAANLVLIETLVVTVFTSFGSAIGKIWLKLKTEYEDLHH
jgi:hypothetical protein